MPELTSEEMTSHLYDRFAQAGTFQSCMASFRQLCEHLGLDPRHQKNFYQQFKSKVTTWQAKSLWAKLDKRFNRKEYKKGKACSDTRVLVIGAGPCGLRTAIECAMLGAKCIVIEKRDSFSRNNVLHLWPFLITDLKNLGAKKFFGKFCAGAIDHISIRQLQLILLKVTLLLGVEVHTNVTFEALQEPPEDQDQESVGWRAKLNPMDHPLSEFEFDVIIGADGKRNTLQGFKRKEFRGKLAIAITANFINRHTTEEARVEEISGVAFIFNQKFFQDLKAATRIDLENIVYYKDDTHYFVMTAKKQSLIEKGVILQDHADTARLLSRENYSHEKLQAYAREAADFSTNHQLPRLDYALNHYGQPDVAMFDFTSIFQAEHASRVMERKGHRLLMALVGDSLLEPFWPTGSGCARGFLGAFDAAWMVRNWSSSQMSPPEVISERESIYRLLPQTTPENLSKVYEQYGLTPTTRYPHVNLKAAAPHEVLHLYDTDNEDLKRKWEKVVKMEKQMLNRTGSIVRGSKLLMWCQRVTDTYKNVHIDNMTTSWRNGLALCAIIHRYRPHLIDFNSLREEDIVRNNQLAFDLAEREFGISPTMTGEEIAAMEAPDKLTMVVYISRFYDLFKDELPPPLKPSLAKIEEVPTHVKSPVAKSSFLSRISSKMRHKKSHHGNKENVEALSPVAAKRPKIKESPEEALKKVRAANLEARMKERIMEQTNARKAKPVIDASELPAGTNRVSGLAEQLTAQFRTLAGLTVTDDNRPVNRPKSKPFEPSKTQNSDVCFFCDKRVYVMERLSVEGLFFHRDCFRCQHCETTLHVGNYVFSKDADGKSKGKFFCRIHYLATLGKGQPTPNRKRQLVEEPSSPKTPVITTIPEDSEVPPSIPSLTDNNLLLEPSQKRYRATPERIELENMRASIAAGTVEVTEEEIAKYNLGTSLQTSGEEDEEDESSESDSELREERSGSVKTLEDEDEDEDDTYEYGSDFESDDEDDSDEESEEDSDEEDSEEDDSDDEEEDENEDTVAQKEEPRYNHISTVVSLKQQWLNDMKAPAMKPWRPPEEILAEQKRAEEAARKAEEAARKAEEEERLREEERRREEEEARRVQEDQGTGIQQVEAGATTPESPRPPLLQKSPSKLKMNLDALSQQYADFEEEAKIPVVPQLDHEGFVGLTDDEKVASMQEMDIDVDNGEEKKDDWLLSGEEEDKVSSEEFDEEYLSSDEVFEMGVLQPSEDSSRETNKAAFDDDGEIIKSPAPQKETSTPSPVVDRTHRSRHQYRNTEEKGDIIAEGDTQPRTASRMSDSSFTISTPSGSFSSVSMISTDSLRPGDFVDLPGPVAKEEIVDLDYTVQSAVISTPQTPLADGSNLDVTLESDEVSHNTVITDAENVGLDMTVESGEVDSHKREVSVDSVALDLSVTSGYQQNDITPQLPTVKDLELSDIGVDMELETEPNTSTKNEELDVDTAQPMHVGDALKPNLTSTPDVVPSGKLQENGTDAKSPQPASKDKPKYRPMYNKRDSGPRLVMSRSFSDSFKEIPALDVISNVSKVEEKIDELADQNANTSNGVVYRNKKKMLPERPDSPSGYVVPPTAIRPTSIKMDTLSQKRERTYSGGTARDRVVKKKEGDSPKKSPKRQLPKVPSKDNGHVDGITPEEREVGKRMLRNKTKRKENQGWSSSGSSTPDIISPIAVAVQPPWEASSTPAGPTPLANKTSSSSDQFFTPETDNPPTSEYLSVSPGERSPLSDHTPSQFTDGIPQSESRSEERKSRLSKLRGDMRRRDALRKTNSPRLERKAAGKKSKKKSKKSKSMSSLSELEDRSAAYRVADSTEASVSAEGELDTPGASAGPRTGLREDLPQIKPTTAQLPRMIRRLTVDPSLTASIDLDFSSSSETEEAAKEEARERGEEASPEAKGKGKGKSPKRMWGKRFKRLRQFKVITKKSPKAVEERRKIEEEELNEKLTRRVQREARRQHHQQKLKRHRMAQEIQRQLQEVEVKQRELENRGVVVEKALRGEGTSEGMDENTLMQQWFNLVNEKNALVRYESELMVQARELELEDRHCQLEQELRQRMAVEDFKKTEQDREVEKLLLEEMLEVVEQRDALVALLEEERLNTEEVLACLKACQDRFPSSTLTSLTVEGAKGGHGYRGDYAEEGSSDSKE
ncbi:F-actin-methionine sulfoxide oxidase MICAL3-like isoform X4 [Acanthaster planci]|uniref:F-actin monooxygenase n=1 Tax=Acanthaster planci TaxID=133434 RepID=A0A8B7ZU32_ACAPL|nr:F-actin-methionine sulfoxide oxidase MICAL3-like isoform X4 [Acanthaster planci]